jgi:hypothetical protein
VVFYARDILTGTAADDAQPQGDFDTTEYRTSTYGAPTHYCDPAATSNGAGTLLSPWTTAQAMSDAVAGNVVGWLPGQSVVHAHSTSTQTPTLNPANSGTLGNPIVHVTKYAAIALTNVTTNALRTQLRHDGVGVVSTGPSSESGDGASMFGSLSRNYITWDGFYVDIDQAEIASDTGCISIRECTGVKVYNFYIKSKELTCNTNAVIYRPNNCVGTVLSNFIIEDHSNVAPGLQAGIASDAYADQDYTIEYGTVRNSDRGFYTKGAPGGVGNYGVMRYLIVHGVDIGLAFNAWDTTGELQEVHHCLIYDYDSVGLQIGTNHPTAENQLIHHCTVANGAATGGGANGPIYIKGGSSATTAFSNYIVRDCIFDWAHAGAGRAVEGGEYTGTTFPTMNYNRYYRVGASVTWTMSSSTLTTIADWRTVLGGGTQEANSDTLASDPFTSRATDDYSIATAALLTADSSGGELGCYEGSIAPGPYGSYGF